MRSFGTMPEEVRARCLEQITAKAPCPTGNHAFEGPVTCQIKELHGVGDNSLRFHMAYICVHCTAQVCDFTDSRRGEGGC